MEVLLFNQYFTSKESITLFQKKEDIFIYSGNQYPLIGKLAKKTKAKGISDRW